MRRRRVIVGLIGLSVLALAVGLAVWSWPNDARPCLAAYRQVRAGMTFDEVCGTIGRPPGDYSRDKYTYAVRANEHYWIADDGLLFVRLDATGRVVALRVEEFAPNRWPS